MLKRSSDQPDLKFCDIKKRFMDLFSFFGFDAGLGVSTLQTDLFNPKMHGGRCTPPPPPVGFSLHSKILQATLLLVAYTPVKKNQRISWDFAYVKKSFDTTNPV